MNARVIITMDCNRKCVGCCNTYEPIMKKATYIESLDELLGYQNIMITGGEPALYPDFVEKFVDEMTGQQVDGRKIYLYSAKWTPMWNKLVTLGKIDGIHYTLHEPLIDGDLAGFEFMQVVAERAKKAGSKISFRSYIDPNIHCYDLKVNPMCWDRLEIKPWIDSGDCELPEDKLFILKMGVDTII